MAFIGTAPCKEPLCCEESLLHSQPDKWQTFQVQPTCLSFKLETSHSPFPRPHGEVAGEPGQAAPPGGRTLPGLQTTAVSHNELAADFGAEVESNPQRL